MTDSHIPPMSQPETPMNTRHFAPNSTLVQGVLRSSEMRAWKAGFRVFPGALARFGPEICEAWKVGVCGGGAVDSQFPPMSATTKSETVVPPKKERGQHERHHY
jgi:hypothetical protein